MMNKNVPRPLSVGKGVLVVVVVLVFIEVVATALFTIGSYLWIGWLLGESTTTILMDIDWIGSFTGLYYENLLVMSPLFLNTPAITLLFPVEIILVSYMVPIAVIAGVTGYSYRTYQSVV